MLIEADFLLLPGSLIYDKTQNYRACFTLPEIYQRTLKAWLLGWIMKLLLHTKFYLNYCMLSEESEQQNWCIENGFLAREIGEDVNRFDREG